MPWPCRAHTVPLPCRAAKGLECVFPIWFTQCGRVWFTLAMPYPDHAFLLKATAQHGRRETAVLYCGLEKNSMVGAWHGHSMESVNQTKPHCVNQMGKTHSKPLAARHGRGTAWARHAMCESTFTWRIWRGNMTCGTWASKERYCEHVSSNRGNTALSLSATTAVWCFYICSKLWVQLYGIKGLGTLSVVYWYIIGIDGSAVGTCVVLWMYRF